MKIIKCFLFLLSFMLSGCVKDAVPNDSNEEALTRAELKDRQMFYYYGIEDRKIFLDQVKDKMFVKFAPTATKEQFRAVETGNVSLRPMDANAEEYFVEGYPSNGVVLEGREIMSSDFLNSFKAKDEVVSVTYLLEYNGVGLSAYTDEFIVKLKDGTSYAQLQELADKNNSRIGKEDEFVKNQYNLYVSKTSERDAMQTANLFYETGLFEFAEPNLIDFNAENSNDQYYSSQWGLKNNGHYGGTSGLDINAEQAWTITKGSSSIRIAVIDSGIDLTHPDLQANLLPGYDATGYGTAGGTYNSGDNHGTAVAGIAGALQNNTYQGSYEGISGVAPGCKIVPVKASINGDFNRAHSSSAINWVVNNNKAEVINCSFGSQNPPTSNLTNAISNAVANGRGGKGCIVIAASGNDNLSTVSYPANLPNVIAVGAISFNGMRKSPTTPDTEWRWGSNYGTALDVVAPGVLIPTTDRRGNVGYNPAVYPYRLHPDAGGTILSSDYTDQNYTVWFNGTSAAAPHVSGVAALMLSVNPDLTSKGVTDIIEGTARKVGGYSYATTSGRTNGTWNNQTGYGLVDAHDAVCRAFGHSFAIWGPEYPAMGTYVSYSVSPVVKPSWITFNGWTITSDTEGATYEAGSMTAGVLSVKFTSLALFNISASFTLPDGRTYGVSKRWIRSIPSPAIAAPVLDVDRSNMGRSIKFTVSNSHPDATYEWDLIQGEEMWSSSNFMHVYCPREPFGGDYGTYLIVRCRAIVDGLISNWSGTHYVMLEYFYP